MLRSLALAAAAGLGLLAAAPNADAAPYGPSYSGYAYGGYSYGRHTHGHHRHHHRQYRVYYRGCAHDPWVIYRGYGSYWDAHRASFSLRARGFEVYVR